MLLHFGRALSGSLVTVAPVLATPSMTADGCTIAFSGGGGYTTLIPQYRLVGAVSWTSIASDTSPPLTFTGLAAGDYEFRALADGNASYASNTVTGTVSEGGVAYTPLKIASFDSLTTGVSAGGTDGFASPQIVGAIPTVSTAIAGPFGGGKVAALIWDRADRYYFGGDIFNGNQSISDGSELWVRWYIYCVPTFAWTFGANGNGDGWGATKWVRQFFADGGDNCFQMYNDGKCWGMTTEGFTGAGANLDFNTASFPAVPQGQWVCQEFYIRFHNTPASGLIRYWQDGVFMAEHTGCTKGVGTKAINRILLGDYWNGGSPQAQVMYFDEVVMTVNAPDALDSSGRPMIGTARRVGDFT